MRAQANIVPIDFSARVTESLNFPREMCVGSFDGAFKRTIVFATDSSLQRKVGFFESVAGVLKTDSFEFNEFVFILGGELVTTDADGTRREFRRGDAFVMPKGWAGTWDMKSPLRKLLVDF